MEQALPGKATVKQMTLATLEIKLLSPLIDLQALYNLLNKKIFF